MIHFFSDDDLTSWCGKKFDHFKTNILLDGKIEDVMDYLEAKTKKENDSEYEICFVCLERQFDKYNKLRNKEN